MSETTIKSKIKAREISVYIGYIIDDSWIEEYSSLMLEQIESGMLNYILPIEYFSFKRESILAGGINTFYSTDKGKTYSMANSFFCKSIFETKEAAELHLKTSVEKHKAELERQLSDLESTTSEINKKLR